MGWWMPTSDWPGVALYFAPVAAITVLLPLEKLFCGATKQCIHAIDDGRPLLLVVAAFLAGVQVADLIFDGPWQGRMEGALDMLVGTTFALATVGVYKSRLDIATKGLRCGMLSAALKVWKGVGLYTSIVGFCTRQVGECGAMDTAACAESQGDSFLGGDHELGDLCEWEESSGACQLAVSQDDCVSAGVEWDLDRLMLPHLLAQCAFCWQLHEWIELKKKQEAGLLAAPTGAEGESAQAAAVPPA